MGCWFRNDLSILFAASALMLGIHPAFAQCDINGGWQQSVPFGASMWVSTPVGNGQYHVQEGGFGNAAGTLDFCGRLLTT